MLRMRRRSDFFENLGKFGFGGLGAIVVIGIFFLIYAVVSRFILNGSQIAFGVFLVLFLVFAALSLVYVIYNESRKKINANWTSTADEINTKELPVPITGKFLSDPVNEPLPSVVEHTTELLKTKPRSNER